MLNQLKLKTAFEPEVIRKEFYTGGPIAATADGKFLVSKCRNHVAITDIETALVKETIPPGLQEYNACAEDDLIIDDILVFTLGMEESLLASGHKSGLIKLWKWKDGKLENSWKSLHKGPIMKLEFNHDGDLLCSAGTDSFARVWNLKTNSCDYKFGGLQGVVSILKYRVLDGNGTLFASGDEYILKGWTLLPNRDHKLTFKLSGHVSAITSISFSAFNERLMSFSRDKVAILWNLKENLKMKTIPLYESIETSVALSIPKSAGFTSVIAVGGEFGYVRLLDDETGKEVLSLKESDEREDAKPITFLGIRGEFLVQADSDQNILFYNFRRDFAREKHLVGCSDEILDLAFFGERECYTAVATNTRDIHVYASATCILLRGHTDIVVTLSTSPACPNILVSGGKDNSIRVWMAGKQMGEILCVASGTRHTASISSVALSRASNPLCLYSAGEEGTLKAWNVSGLKYGTLKELEMPKTAVAHDKRVNCVSVSPNDKLVSTASQDKTAKVWSAAGDLSLLGVLRGHRRGVWCAKFSPVDQLLVTSSADATLRIWAISDFTCLKTFEGHDASVLNCAFFNHGIQLISCGGDGLVKLWCVRKAECVATLDKHAAKVWALAVSSDESKIVTGGVDSRIIVWADRTEMLRMTQAKDEKDKAEQEQILANLVQAKDLLPAMQLALKLKRPKQCLLILENLINKDMPGYESLVEKLTNEEKETLIEFAAVWNTNSKTSYVAQIIVSSLLFEIYENRLRISDITLEGLIAYTERHRSRISKLQQDFNILEYVARVARPYSEVSDSDITDV